MTCRHRPIRVLFGSPPCRWSALRRGVSLLYGLPVATALLGCDGEVPASCLDLCDEATRAQGECLAADGLGWDAAGYADEADYADACETWAWEQVRIDRAAGRAGETASECDLRAEAVGTGSCDALEAAFR